MKLVSILIFSLFALAPFAGAAETQIFATSAGPVKITPLNHASTLIEAGGKVIYLDPAKPAKLAGLPKADLILITDIHGDHMDPDSIKEISQTGTDILRVADGGQGHRQRQTACEWRNQNLAEVDD